jgi:tetratricopeptide (TPR) repeat protein
MPKTSPDPTEPKRPKRNGRKPSLQRSAPDAMPSRVPMDKTMADLSKLLASREFDSINEVNAFIQQMLTNNDGQLPELPPETPLEQAQALIYQAYEATSPKQRSALARQALDISPDCADAYLLLAELNPSIARKVEFLEQAAAAGERAIGPEQFEAWQGHFWGVIETRPYMRALGGLAELSWMLGNRPRAIEIYTRMLALNPGDNQGVRYMLASCLLEERTNAARLALHKLLDEFPDDAAANWAYSRALLQFQEQRAPTPPANQALKVALKANKHIPAFLLGDRRMPSDLPPYIGFGDESEAVEYVAFAIRAWTQTPGAIAWLHEVAKR